VQQFTRASGDRFAPMFAERSRDVNPSIALKIPWWDCFFRESRYSMYGNESKARVLGASE